MRETASRFLDRGYWLEENQKYSRPHFRLEKCARIVNSLAGGRSCDLLDVGCGPGTLATLLDKNISYYGIDIAIHNPAPNLLEKDFARESIGFGDKKFDIIVAAGVFEYMGGYQKQKFLEIRSILRNKGQFVLTFSNFGHVHGIVDYYPYNNTQSIEEFKRELEDSFHIDRCFPSSHNWMFSEPRREWLKRIQINLNVHIPVLSPLLALNYFFICS